MSRVGRSFAFLLVLSAALPEAQAQVASDNSLGGAAGIADPALSLAGDVADELESSSCRDDWPEGRERPTLVERFPQRGVSGHVAWLELDFKHLPGEVVLPAGVEAMTSIAQASAEIEALQSAHFLLPKQESETQPVLERESEQSGGKTETHVRIPFIPLPEEAGRFELTLPRLPISVARASGQVHTICTLPHVITVEDALASEPSPQPKADPEARSQVEVWTKMRDTVYVLLWALPLALLLAWLLYRYRDRFKRVPAPPAPIPPWDKARAQLSALEAEGLLQNGEFEKYLDAVTDTLREYLGGRYGFDGLESTTREVLRQLTARAPDFTEEQAVRSILQRTDLVKFARRIPDEEECREAMELTRKIVERSRPSPSLDPRRSPSAPQGKSSSVTKEDADE